MENNSEDIFNLDDLTDVPAQLKSELKVLSRDDFEVKIIELFQMANRPLNIDQVTVGFYRKYKFEKSRSTIATKLYNMTRGSHGALVSIKDKKGLYELRGDFESKEAME